MKENEILKTAVNFTMTVNLGNGNFAKLGSTLETNISNIDEYEQAFDALYTKIRAKISNELGRINTVFQREVKNT